MPLTPPSPVPTGGNIANYDLEHISITPGSDAIELSWVGKDAGGNVLARGTVQATGGVTWWTNNHVAILNRLAVALGVVGGTVT